MKQLLDRHYFKLALTACVISGIIWAALFSNPDDELQLPLQATGELQVINNNQALTPPMGWASWNAFHLDIDENKLYGIADALVAHGLLDLGYKQLNIDDGWWLKRRSTDGRLLIKSDRFPSTQQGQNSFRPLTDHLHNMGLKVGIYSDAGRNTCGQFWDSADPNQPRGTIDEAEVGTMDYTQQDMDLFFREWNFDYIKLDGCGLRHYSAPHLLLYGLDDRYRSQTAATDLQVKQRYQQLQEAISNTGKNVTYSICVWGEANVNHWGANVGNLWRTSADITPHWDSMLYNYESAVTRELYAGPGRWNDPDMLFIGQGDFSEQHTEQARAHFSLWAMLAAPLILGNDLRHISSKTLELISNPQVIAINQDPAGHQATRIRHSDEIDVLLKSLSTDNHSPSGQTQKALLILNKTTKKKSVQLVLPELLLADKANLVDVWSGENIRYGQQSISLEVPAKGVRLLKLTGRHILGKNRFLSELPGQLNLVQHHANTATVMYPQQLATAGFDEYQQALAIHPNSLLQWQVPKGAQKLRTKLTVNYLKPSQHKVTATLFADGQQLRQYVLLKGEDAKISFDLDVSQYKLIELAVNATGDYKHMQLLWLEPEVSF